ncbi:hypothetical protein AVEN_225271-1 [Araneus ventricosus]|uniref:Endonuclease/exonuclease/phosphatase domain-containing protein n=1 Tax=Araneus ventricosus TaxID=182803 RepID=A0A4Y2AMY2_ARAVE|nr:hypothetical protein AVEN_225271-1 [Araneus ventricosus]
MAPPTFQRRDMKGWPGLKLCTQGLINSINQWEVLEERTLSDHNYIKANIASAMTSFSLKKYKTKYSNHRKLISKIEPLVNPLIEEIHLVKNQDELNIATIHLHTAIIQGCNMMYKIKKQELTATPTWYTQDLEIRKNRLLAFKRRSQRATAENRAEGSSIKLLSGKQFHHHNL